MSVGGSASGLIGERLRQIREEIRGTGRDPATVTVVAVGKTFGPETLRAAYDAGVRNFGENRAQEAATKIPHLPTDIVWHFIGHLQANKVRQVVGPFAWIHSLDRPEIIDAVARRAAAGTAPTRCLIQVNLSGEETKSGCRRDEVRMLAEKLLSSPGIVAAGLMTIPPPFPDPEQARPFFRELAAERDRLRSEFGAASFPFLSMGMTDDYRVAVEEGATHIRIGRGLFGTRS